MPLGIKVLLTLLAGATLALLAQIAILGENLLPGFEAIDRKAAEREVRQVRLALESEVEKIEAFGRDWAGWDESYLFLANPSEELPQSDLVYASLASEAIDFFGLYDPKGDLHWAGISDRHVEGLSDTSAGLSRLVKSGLPLRTRALPEQSVGLLGSEAGPIMIAAFPVIPHQTSHQPLGKLVVGRLLDADLLARLAGKTGLTFDLQAAPAPTQQEDTARGAAASLEFLEGQARARTVLADALGIGTFHLTVELPDGALRQGTAAVGESVLAFAAIAVALVVFCFVIIYVFVVQPLVRLSHRLIVLVHEERWSERLNVQRSDVLGLLGDEVDGLLTRLENLRRGAVEAEATPFVAISGPSQPTTGDQADVVVEDSDGDGDGRGER